MLRKMRGGQTHVKVEHVRLVLVDDLPHLPDEVVVEALADFAARGVGRAGERAEGAAEALAVARFRAVEPALVRRQLVLRIAGIRLRVPRRVPGEEPLVVHGGDEPQALRSDLLGQLADDVALRPHLRGVPVRDGRLEHGEAVGVLGDGAGVARPGAGVERRPFRRVELGRLEHSGHRCENAAE